MKNNNLKIKVIGIGNGGQNIADYLYTNNKSKNIEFIVINSDEQLLNLSVIENKYIMNGSNSNEQDEALGCGGNPRLGEKYALQHIDKIRKIVGTTDLVVLISSFGGGCGTGATPVIAKMLNDANIKTIAIIGKPFDWEGKTRIEYAINGVEELKQYTKECIIMDYQHLIDNILPNTTLKASWNYVYENVANEFYKIIKSIQVEFQSYKT